ncbi:hypothetical protein LINPERHAP1_LOCUS23314 [Linum perenne]
MHTVTIISIHRQNLKRIEFCFSTSLSIIIHQSIMTRNSSKLRTPSPSKSNRLTMASHSLRDLHSPSLVSIDLRLRGVINPQFSQSYIWKASFKSRNLSFSSLAASSMSWTSLTKSSIPSS